MDSNVISMARKKDKELAKSNEWTIHQEILQDILADYIAREEKPPKAIELVEMIREQIKLRFVDQPETVELLISVGPSCKQTISKWRQKKDWNDAVWNKLKVEHLFTAEKRAAVLQAVFNRATNSNADNTSSAKLFLTCSGDYKEKLDLNQNDALEQYREINALLQKRKEDDE